MIFHSLSNFCLLLLFKSLHVSKILISDTDTIVNTTDIDEILQTFSDDMVTIPTLNLETNLTESITTPSLDLDSIGSDLDFSFGRESEVDEWTTEDFSNMSGFPLINVNL